MIDYADVNANILKIAFHNSQENSKLDCDNYQINEDQLSSEFIVSFSSFKKNLSLSLFPDDKQVLIYEYINKSNDLFLEKIKFIFIYKKKYTISSVTIEKDDDLQGKYNLCINSFFTEKYDYAFFLLKNI